VDTLVPSAQETDIRDKNQGESLCSLDGVWKSHLLEQYKLYVEMADRISQRRAVANTYFLSLNSAILAFVGYIPSTENSSHVWLLALAGCILAIFWHDLINSYRNLSSAKWRVVNDIEKQLPIKPYSDEWEIAQKGKNPKLYRPITHIEKRVPVIFGLLHVVVFCMNFPLFAIMDWFCLP